MCEGGKEGGKEISKFKSAANEWQKQMKKKKKIGGIVLECMKEGCVGEGEGSENKGEKTKKMA